MTETSRQSAAVTSTSSRAVPPVADVSWKVAELAQCDARGDHARAVHLLADWTAQGDVDAMTELGKRLLVGFQAPFEPQQGTELIIKAANLGGAAAASQLAVLAAIGMHIDQSWQTALAAIVFSAELGWPKARGQLRVLSADRDLAAQDLHAENPDPKLWRRLADAIDLNRWHQPSPGVNLCESPVVRHLPGLVSRDVCQWMIEHARPRLTRALVYDAVEDKSTANQTRTNTVALFNVTNSDLVSVLIQVQICANTGASFRQLEPLSVLHYEVGEQIIEHFDFVDPDAPTFNQQVAEYGQRRITFLLYLNEDYTGGETELPKLGISHKGQLGGGFFFVNIQGNDEPDLRTLHAGRPPIRGEKWVVSQWVRSRATF
jgi:prolyl 4-hydroxylase